MKPIPESPQLPDPISIPKELIEFGRPYMRTQEGKEAMKQGEYYKRIKADMEVRGLINPLVCIKEGDLYRICLGHKRYLIGCDLGMTHFPTIVVETEDKDYLKAISANYKPTGADNAWWEYLHAKGSQSETGTK